MTDLERERERERESEGQKDEVKQNERNGEIRLVEVKITTKQSSYKNGHKGRVEGSETCREETLQGRREGEHR